MALAPQAPYDALSTITQMVRTLLGDFIAGIQPNNAGVVNVGGGGFSITWVSGNQFSALMNNAPILINGVPNVIAMVTSPTTATLVNQAAVGNGKAYSLVIPTGDIFSDSQAYVLPTINLGWRKVQKQMAIKGHPRLENTAIVTGLPVIANLDPAVEQYINWQGFYDGVTFWTPGSLAGCPVLPQDLIIPLHLDERQSVSGATPTNPNLNVLRPMHPAPNGLRSKAKGSWNRYWDWREDAIYLRGAIVAMDMKLRYAAYLADIAPGATFAQTPVPILGCGESVANYSAAIFVTPRGGQALAQGFNDAGDMAIAKITSEATKLKQRASVSRIAWGTRGRRRRGHMPY